VQNWTRRHRAFIRSIRFDDVHAQAVLEEYVLAIAEQVEQVKRFDQLMEEATRWITPGSQCDLRRNRWLPPIREARRERRFS
jgi:hypothetical protein